jgi:hypothetical protein
MLNKFVVNHSRDYFNNICNEIAIQIIEVRLSSSLILALFANLIILKMDAFARSAQNESNNR